MDNLLNTTPKNLSVLCQGLSFSKADLKVSHDISISSEFNGSIESTAKVSLEENAVFKGSIKCKEFVCKGNFDGSIEVCNLAVFSKNCSVKGSIKAGRISVEDGAYLKLKVSIAKAPKKISAEPVKK